MNGDGMAYMVIGGVVILLWCGFILHIAFRSNYEVIICPKFLRKFYGHPGDGV